MKKEWIKNLERQFGLHVMKQKERDDMWTHFEGERKRQREGSE